MKTLKLTQLIKIAFVTFLSALTLWGCAKTPNDKTVVSGYQLVNGQCVATGTNQIVQMSYCQNVNNGYQLVNGQCYQTATNQIVQMSYCQNTNNGYQLINGQCYQTATNQIVQMQYCSGAGGSQQCFGMYTNGYQTGQCNGSNCSGLTLIEISTGRQVTCL